MDTLLESFRGLITLVLILMGASVVIALVGLVALTRGIRRLRIPRDADFFTTMRHIPLALVIVLDLLDFGLDIFSAPIIWIALDRMGLPNLRNKATFEALIPFTNVIPTFTASWFAARLLGLGQQPWEDQQPYWSDRDPRALPRRVPPRRPPRIIDMDEHERR